MCSSDLDFTQLADRSGQSIDGVRAVLEGAEALRDDPKEWARATVRVLVPADQLATREGQGRALDTYLKARNRAQSRLAALLAAHRMGGAR